MLASRWSLVMLVLLTPLVNVAVARAQMATPTASALPSPVDSTACTVAPRPTEKIRQLMLEGIAQRGQGTPVVADDAAPSVVHPADPATVEAVTATVAQFYACSNAGNLAAVVALTTDDVARKSLGGMAIFYGHLITSGQGTPAPHETPAPAVLDVLLASFSVRVPLPSDQQETLLDVRDVAVLSNGWVQAVVVTTSASDPAPVAHMMYLANVDGQYRYGGDSRLPADQVATPGAGTPTS